MLRRSLPDETNSRSLEERLPPISRKQCEHLIGKEIAELAEKSDFVVVVVYDREEGAEPVDYTLYDYKKGATPQDVPSQLDFEGIWVWYFCTHNGENFQAHKLLIELEDGHYVNGQFGEFEGFWDEFPQYVAKDRWVASNLSS